MIKEMQIPVFQLVSSISSTTDLVNPSIANHHNLVSYIAYHIADEIGCSLKERKDILLAGALHDLGAFSLKEKMDIMDFEMADPHGHADVGYRLLHLLGSFDRVATIVKYHHVAWNYGQGEYHEEEPVPDGSHILHLADRVAVLISSFTDPRGEAQAIVSTVKDYAGAEFKPDYVEAFRNLAAKEFFWLDIEQRLTSTYIQRLIIDGATAFDLDGLARIAHFFAQLIDFRSPFTATHSSGVAASAVALAEYMAFSKVECAMMKVAGYLHDLGKLAVPTEILEKPAALAANEWKTIKAHTYYGYRALEPITDLKTINEWASFHHERLDGKGYPFHLNSKELTLGSRIMAVADVFTAITENRPYRRGMRTEEAKALIQQFCANGALDRNVVDTLLKNFADINDRRNEAQRASIKDYENFLHNG